MANKSKTAALVTTVIASLVVIVYLFMFFWMPSNETIRTVSMMVSVVYQKCKDQKFVQTP